MTDFDLDRLMSALERKQKQNSMATEQSYASRPSTAPQSSGTRMPENPHSNPPPGQKGSFWNKIWMRSADAKVKLQESDKIDKKTGASTKSHAQSGTQQAKVPGYPADLTQEQLEMMERARKEQAERARKEAELKRLERELHEMAMREKAEQAKNSSDQIRRAQEELERKEAALRKKEADLKDQEERIKCEKAQKEDLLARKQRQTDEVIRRRQEEEERAAKERLRALEEKNAQERERMGKERADMHRFTQERMEAASQRLAQENAERLERLRRLTNNMGSMGDTKKESKPERPMDAEEKVQEKLRTLQRQALEEAEKRREEMRRAAARTTEQRGAMRDQVKQQLDEEAKRRQEGAKQGGNYADLLEKAQRAAQEAQAKRKVAEEERLAKAKAEMDRMRAAMAADEQRRAKAKETASRNLEEEIRRKAGISAEKPAQKEWVKRAFAEAERFRKEAGMGGTEEASGSKPQNDESKYPSYANMERQRRAAAQAEAERRQEEAEKLKARRAEYERQEARARAAAAERERARARNAWGSQRDTGASGTSGTSTGHRKWEDFINANRARPSSAPAGGRRMRDVEMMESVWKQLEGSEQPIRYEDIPWPPIGSKHVLHWATSAGGAHDASARKKVYRALVLRWHPDKFEAKFGSKVAPSHKEQIMSQVQEISQNLNLEFNDLKSQGRA
mmetsp:Transcript_14989/g.32198  ORF Transcript_14989/g.32198 Transcript_14989/m.32198 type:complete len:682 (-) Transcript_14989:416-2461(-)|eukprot:CAMPEP_0118958382 /NCGR_PEP_ID=MMETSP1169-20130426/62593_1 /TAXON_ID=36882 /ORGANISM="Pyramimonas obovata, Strain CCMP722" /LENGTH=681 /DNA_ID=CAMNT_0006906497 /DNA_START=143 /DNA_END=2188 /DNA_ORIENTATION=+